MPSLKGVLMLRFVLFLVVLVGVVFWIGHGLPDEWTPEQQAALNCAARGSGWVGEASGLDVSECSGRTHRTPLVTEGCGEHPHHTHTHR